MKKEKILFYRLLMIHKNVVFIKVFENKKIMKNKINVDTYKDDFTSTSNAVLS